MIFILRPFLTITLLTLDRFFIISMNRVFCPYDHIISFSILLDFFFLEAEKRRLIIEFMLMRWSIENLKIGLTRRMLRS